MTEDDKSVFRSILDHISGMDYIKPEDLPNIDLYMDQVTTFMEDQLASTKRHEDDKILTKTMINNYAKNNLLPSPEKKRYSKDHLLMLIFIYYFKNILSITDIQKLLGPITEKYFKGEPGKDMTYVYNEVFGMENRKIDQLIKNVLKDYRFSSATFQDADEEDQEFLKRFSFICLMSFDVYIKKMIIEKMIDDISPAEDKSSKKTKEKSANHHPMIRGFSFVHVSPVLLSVISRAGTSKLLIRPSGPADDSAPSSLPFS